MDRGDLVPDEVVIAMVMERLAARDCRAGFVLDGFPRTVNQAEALDRRLVELGTPLDAALSFEVTEEELLRRLAGRAAAQHRADDAEQTIRHRLEVFAQKTRPLIDYYRHRRLLTMIDGVGRVEDVTLRILDRLPLADGGYVVETFLSGQPYLSGQADLDPSQPRGVVAGLGIRSQIDVALDVGGVRRGVLGANSAEPERWSERDLRFLEAVARWVGMVTQRAELAEELAFQAERRGERKAAEELAKLTRRQQEIAVCIAEGLSNAEIAARLVLVEGTVANHVEAILNRLGVRNRTQIGVWAVERGLYHSGWTD
jgi:adenylate kinase